MYGLHACRNVGSLFKRLLTNLFNYNSILLKEINILGLELELVQNLSIMTVHRYLTSIFEALVINKMCSILTNLFRVSHERLKQMICPLKLQYMVLSNVGK